MSLCDARRNFKCLLLLLVLVILTIFIRLYEFLHTSNIRTNPIAKLSRIIKYNNTISDSKDTVKLKDNNRLRIALIKPDAVHHLYHSGYGDETVLIEKAAKHWGPIGLFHAEYFSTDYYIIYTNHGDLSTSQWAEPLVDCWLAKNSNISQQIQVPQRPREGHLVKGVYRSSYINITKSAVFPTDISWHNYDLVLSLSPAVSPDVISKYPSTLWAYWIVEGCQRSYIQSKKGNLVHGWDLFLTQDFNLYTSLPKNVVEFPLIFDYHGGLVDLLQTDMEKASLNIIRSGILLLPSRLSLEERYLFENIEYFDFRHNRSMKVVLTELRGTTPQTMRLHLQRKYAIIWNRTSRGNALAEAWSGGLLVLGRTNGVINHDIVGMSGCEFRTAKLLVEKIVELEQNEHLFYTYLLRQRKLFDMLAFYGPLRELITKGMEIMQYRVQDNRSNLRNVSKRWSQKPVNIFTSWHHKSSINSINQ